MCCSCDVDFTAHLLLLSLQLQVAAGFTAPNYCGMPMPGHLYPKSARAVASRRVASNTPCGLNLIITRWLLLSSGSNNAQSDAMLLLLRATQRNASRREEKRRGAPPRRCLLSFPAAGCRLLVQRTEYSKGIIIYTNTNISHVENSKLWRALILSFCAVISTSDTARVFFHYVPVPYGAGAHLI